MTVQTGENRSKKSIIKGLTSVKNTYTSRGFCITDIHADNEFDMDDLRDAMRPSSLHIYGAEEHVGKIERAVQTVKERCRSMCHSLLYTKYTKLMINGLVEYVIFWLNAFPNMNGASNTMSPSTIITGSGKPDLALNHIAMGSYATVFAGTENNMKSRGVPAIALRPSNNRGGYYFMSLLTGERVHL